MFTIAVLLGPSTSHAPTSHKRKATAPPRRAETQRPYCSLQVPDLYMGKSQATWLK